MGVEKREKEKRCKRFGSTLKRRMLFFFFKTENAEPVWSHSQMPLGIKKNDASDTLQQTRPRRLRWQAAGQAGGRPGQVILVVAITFSHGG